jgi:hypothetical protein
VKYTEFSNAVRKGGTVGPEDLKSLEHSTNLLPKDVCQTLGVEVGTTFGAAAKMLLVAFNSLGSTDHATDHATDYTGESVGILATTSKNPRGITFLSFEEKRAFLMRATGVTK